MQRRRELDALRGLMLVMMTVTHLPVQLAERLGQPFGFVSAAEGFVFLSAFMAGMVYTQRAAKDGIRAMHQAFMRRALVIYACQAALLLFVFTIIAGIGVKIHQPAITDLLSFFLHEPVRALLGSLALLYNPPLLDILPLYVMLMLASPFLLAWGLHRGWAGIMAGSVLLWLLAQFGLGEALYEVTLARTALGIPYSEMGAFDSFAWQFLWVLGLWLGAEYTRSAAPGGRLEATHHPADMAGLPRWLLWTAIGIVVTGMLWRHIGGQAPFGANVSLNMTFDKWQLAPLRLIGFFAMLVVVLRFAEPLGRLIRIPFLETLGAASLPVFCAHLVAVLLALALAGTAAQHSRWVDAVLLTGSFALLYVVARAFTHVEHKVVPRLRRPPRPPAEPPLSAGVPQ